MPDQRDRPLFLAQRGYRQRRVIDAACLLPVFGAFLLLLPVLWDVGGGSGASGTAEDARLAERTLYVFAVWALLVVAAALLGRRLRQTETPPQPPDAVIGDATLPQVDSRDAPVGRDATGAPGEP